MLHEMTRYGISGVFIGPRLDEPGLFLSWRPRDPERPKARDWINISDHEDGIRSPNAVCLSQADFRGICEQGAKHPYVSVPSAPCDPTIEVCNLGFEHMLPGHPGQVVDNTTKSVCIHCPDGPTLRMTYPVFSDLVRCGLDALRRAKRQSTITVSIVTTVPAKR